MAARVNAEYINERLNILSRNAFGLRSFDNARFRIKSFLGCPVSLSEELKRQEV
ncbi:MAG: hypothetical protein ACTSYS_13780 [Promethearchaeota archaeon]